MVTLSLYHFTCDHGRQGIGKRGRLQPHINPLLGCKVVWLTTQALPSREQTGLTSRYLTCDRMQFRYVVSGIGVAACEPWLTSSVRKAAGAVVEDLESFGDPENWWIARRPVTARLDRTYVAAEESVA
jgi:hypothetical protein